MIRAHVDGETLEGLGDEILDDLEPRLVTAGTRAAEIAVAHAKQIVGRPVTRSERGEIAFNRQDGDTVQFGGRRRVKATAGEPPRKDRGDLQRSLHAKPAKVRKRSVEVPWGSDLPEAGRMEWGGKDKRGIYLPPHAYLRPAEAQAKAEIDAVLEDVL